MPQAFWWTALQSKSCLSTSNDRGAARRRIERELLLDEQKTKIHNKQVQFATLRVQREEMRVTGGTPGASRVLKTSKESVGWRSSAAGGWLLGLCVGRPEHQG